MVFSMAAKAISEVKAPEHELLTRLVVNSIDAFQGAMVFWQRKSFCKPCHWNMWKNTKYVLLVPEAGHGWEHCTFCAKPVESLVHSSPAWLHHVGYPGTCVSRKCLIGINSVYLSVANHMKTNNQLWTQAVLKWFTAAPTGVGIPTVPRCCTSSGVCLHRDFWRCIHV